MRTVTIVPLLTPFRVQAFRLQARTERASHQRRKPTAAWTSIPTRQKADLSRNLKTRIHSSSQDSDCLFLLKSHAHRAEPALGPLVDHIRGRDVIGFAAATAATPAPMRPYLEKGGHSAETV